MDYGADFDFSRPFFAQFRELSDRVPRPARSFKNLENSDYCNNSSSIRNCYLVFNTSGAEDCLCGENVWDSKSCLDCSQTKKSELCYDCTACLRCYNLQSSIECDACQDSYFLLNCRSCSHCFGCANLRHTDVAENVRTHCGVHFTAVFICFCSSSDSSSRCFSLCSKLKVVEEERAAERSGANDKIVDTGVKRNMHLLREGRVMRGSQAATGLSEEELAERDYSACF